MTNKFSNKTLCKPVNSFSAAFSTWWRAYHIRIEAAIFCSLAMFSSVGCQDNHDLPAGLSVLGPSEHIFGVCHQGDVLTHVFTLVNKTDKPIEVVGLRSSCTCVVPGGNEGFHETTIRPNGEVLLPVTFAVGSQQKIAAGRVIVFYQQGNDTTQRELRKHLELRVRASILPDYRIEPRELNFGDIDGLAVEQVTERIRITPNAIKHLDITNVKCSSDRITARLLPSDDEAGGFAVEVTLDPSRFITTRPFNTSLVLTTSSERVPKALVRIHANYLAPVNLSPDVIVISSDEHGDIGREIRITTSCPSCVRAADCSAAESLRVEFDSQERSREHRAKLIVFPVAKRSLDCKVAFEMVLFPNGGKGVVRTLCVPVYRFLEKGD